MHCIVSCSIILVYVFFSVIVQNYKDVWRSIFRSHIYWLSTRHIWQELLRMWVLEGTHLYLGWIGEMDGSRVELHYLLFLELLPVSLCWSTRATRITSVAGMHSMEILVRFYYASGIGLPVDEKLNQSMNLGRSERGWVRASLAPWLFVILMYITRTGWSSLHIYLRRKELIIKVLSWKRFPTNCKGAHA